MVSRCAAILLAAPILACGLSVGAEQKDDKEALQGTWNLVSMEISGKKIPADALKKRKSVVIEKSTWTSPTGRKFTFKIDPAKSPKVLDVQIERNGRTLTWRGIYKLKGDTLTFCRTHSANRPRPNDFKGGEGVAILVLKKAGK